jgi:hypothetical protein
MEGLRVPDPKEDAFPKSVTKVKNSRYLCKLAAQLFA